MSKYTEQPSAAPTWDVINDDKVTNILLIGTDKGDDGLSSRSDTTMLVSIDNRTKSLRLVSFLRDMYLEIPTLEGKHKFNAAYANGGAALTMQTLENNFRIQIDKYVEIDFENFEQVIDKMGGIDIDMSAKSAAYENEVMGSNMHEGVNHLDGRLALYYARCLLYTSFLAHLFRVYLRGDIQVVVDIVFRDAGHGKGHVLPIVVFKRDGAAHIHTEQARGLFAEYGGTLIEGDIRP